MAFQYDGLGAIVLVHAHDSRIVRQTHAFQIRAPVHALHHAIHFALAPVCCKGFGVKHIAVRKVSAMGFSRAGGQHRLFQVPFAQRLVRAERSGHRRVTRTSVLRFGHFDVVGSRQISKDRGIPRAAQQA